MTDLVTVIIPVYNVEKYLAKCVNSIIKQSYKKLQIILVDDGSSDSSGAICDELLLLDERIEVFHQKNKGVSSARNKGIDLAQGEYIAFVDPDDFLAPNMYEVLIGNIKKYSAQCSSVSMKKIYESDGHEELLTPVGQFKIQSGEEALDDAMSLDDPWLGYSVNKLFLKDIIDVNNIRFNENIIMNEDSIFCYEYMSYCLISVRYTLPLYNYLIRKTSATQTIFKDNDKLFHLIDSSEILYNFGKLYRGRKFFTKMQYYYINVHIQLIYYMFVNNIFDLCRLKSCFLKIDAVIDELGYFPLSWKRNIFYSLVKRMPLFVFHVVRLKILIF